MWNENLYSITPRSNGKISISMAYRKDTETLCDTSDEVLEYMVGSDRLRDVITQVAVLDRSHLSAPTKNKDGEMTFEVYARGWLERQTKYAPGTIAFYPAVA